MGPGSTLPSTPSSLHTNPSAPAAPLPAVATVVHLSPLEMVRLPAYRAWLASFGDQATHILVAESQASPVPVMRKSAVVQVGWAAGEGVGMGC